MRLGPLLALPPIALGIGAAAWMIATAPGPAQVGSAEAEFPVRVMTLASETIRPTATVWGNLHAAETWVAVAEVQGEVIWRHPELEAGRVIPAGTEVLRIDPADYDLALAQAKADLAALEAERAQLQAEAENTARILALEQDRLTLTETDLDRSRRLTEQGSAPQSRADEAERSTLLARRTVAEQENALALIPAREARIAAQIARTEAAILRARRSLDQTILTAPFDLRVTEVAAERFQTVSPGQVVIRGDGISAVEVVAHLPLDAFRRLIGDVPDDMNLIEMMRAGPGARIEATLSPLSDPDQTWDARVSRVEGALDARARTVPVVVTVDDPYRASDPPRRLPLVPNMQVSITLIGAPLSGVLTIPESTLHGGMVRIADKDDLLDLRAVTPAFAQDGRVIIAEGLSPGDRLVIDDIAPAIPGLALAPVEARE
ncbi:efflux RND transporter periplasmic adaptor subunit [Tropicimonas sp. IMCC6043]|uniref:efflux RND transporter periplasmic adaptor subunit n=1 Tax=Tropicimonas sp. IMCC6043 TaxID=2510645 RepID=UPI00101C6772|nr:HlyD family efflux transporter periplasmic adaptor subunit [Tropicimonas sp. IMCC6043]RYH06437.1 HlyD family efflux transporter periplasmic adaptor subunit [Tropicimonas sp. IMCC6043]